MGKHKRIHAILMIEDGGIWRKDKIIIFEYCGIYK